MASGILLFLFPVSPSRRTRVKGDVLAFPPHLVFLWRSLSVIFLFIYFFVKKMIKHVLRLELFTLRLSDFKRTKANWDKRNASQCPKALWSVLNKGFPSCCLAGNLQKSREVCFYRTSNLVSCFCLVTCDPAFSWPPTEIIS